MTSRSRKLHVLPLVLYAAMSLASTTSAWADAQPQPFVLTAYGSAPGGEDLLNGRYPAAVQQLRVNGSHALQPAAVSANSCVAYAMTLHWRAAQGACNAAVRDARNARLAAAPWTESATISTDRALAAAYSDRAVMRWMAGDAHGAHADLERARSFAPQAGFVLKNVRALRAHRSEMHANGS
jgi:hypothetical protein